MQKDGWGRKHSGSQDGGLFLRGGQEVELMHPGPAGPTWQGQPVQDGADLTIGYLFMYCLSFTLLSLMVFMSADSTVGFERHCLRWRGGL